MNHILAAGYVAVPWDALAIIVSTIITTGFAMLVLLVRIAFIFAAIRTEVRQLTKDMEGATKNPDLVRWSTIAAMQKAGVPTPIPGGSP